MSVNESGGRDDDVVVRKGEHGWIVGNEKVSDLTSAMVLADLFAADQVPTGTADLESVDGFGTTSRPSRHAAPGSPPTRPTAPSSRGRSAEREESPSPVRAMPPGATDPGTPRDRGAEAGEAERLAVTVTQLEHALASRVRVEQAIGVLAERHRLRPRDAFDLLRRAARSRGRRVTDMAQDVVASAANPLLRLPEELARALPEPRQRGRSMRRAGRHAQRA